MFLEQKEVCCLVLGSVGGGIDFFHYHKLMWEIFLKLWKVENPFVQAWPEGQENGFIFAEYTTELHSFWDIAFWIFFI